MSPAGSNRPDSRPSTLVPCEPVRVTPAQSWAYCRAARLARCKISWNRCSWTVQYAAACSSPAGRARRSFSRMEACRIEMDLENETVTSV
jgi:hypothetical protein